MLKQKVLKIFGGKCAVSKNSRLECDLAHVIPKAISTKYQNDTNNCLILSSSLHRLFDNFLWTFDVFSVEESSNVLCKLGIIISHKISKVKTLISQYNNVKVELPTSMIPFLYCHYRVFFIQNYTTYNKNWTVKQQYEYYMDDSNFSCASIKKFSSVNKKKRYISIVGHDKTLQNFLVVWQYKPYSESTWIKRSDILDKQDIDMYCNMISETLDPNFK